MKFQLVIKNTGDIITVTDRKVFGLNEAKAYYIRMKQLKEKEFDQDKLTSLLINIIENKDDYLNKKNNLEKFCYQNTWNNINEKVISSLNEN